MSKKIQLEGLPLSWAERERIKEMQQNVKSSGRKVFPLLQTKELKKICLVTDEELKNISKENKREVFEL